MKETDKTDLGEIEINLLPCPFCGEQPYRASDVNGQQIIRCIPCSVKMIFDRKDKAIGEWNKRVELPKLQAEQEAHRITQGELEAAKRELNELLESRKRDIDLSNY